MQENFEQPKNMQNPLENFESRNRTLRNLLLTTLGGLILAGGVNSELVMANQLPEIPQIQNLEQTLPGFQDPGMSLETRQQSDKYAEDAARRATAENGQKAQQITQDRVEAKLLQDRIQGLEQKLNPEQNPVGQFTDQVNSFLKSEIEGNKVADTPESKIRIEGLKILQALGEVLTERQKKAGQTSVEVRGQQRRIGEEIDTHLEIDNAKNQEQKRIERLIPIIHKALIDFMNSNPLNKELLLNQLKTAVVESGA